MKLPEKKKTLQFMCHTSSAKETQEPHYTHFWHCLGPKKIFKKSTISLIIWAIPSRSRETCKI